MRSADFDETNRLAAEIQEEMAAAYFAACRKMVDCLKALKTFDTSIASSNLDDEQIAHRVELLEEAAERVYFVLIQREAIKLLDSTKFFEDYDVPDEVKARLGPKMKATRSEPDWRYKG